MKDPSAAPILLIEDNPMDVDLTQRAFARRKVLNPVHIARDGEEALDRIAQWPADAPLPLVILLDLKLPKVDGLEVLRHIREDERFRNVPVVVLTTSSEDRDVHTAYQLYANSYIVKPVDFDKFVQVADRINVYWCAVNTPPR
jgi:hypothetical protein